MVAQQEDLKEVRARVVHMQHKIKETHARQQRMMQAATKYVYVWVGQRDMCSSSNEVRVGQAAKYIYM